MLYSNYKYSNLYFIYRSLRSSRSICLFRILISQSIGNISKEEAENKLLASHSANILCYSQAVNHRVYYRFVHRTMSLKTSSESSILVVSQLTNIYAFSTSVTDNSLFSEYLSLLVHLHHSAILGYLADGLALGNLGIEKLGIHHQVKISTS